MVSPFDYWTLGRVGFFFLLGVVVAAKRLNRGLAVISVFVVAAEWEVFERLAALRYPDVWSAEPWLNSAVDLLTVGAMLVAFRLFDKNRSEGA